MSKSGEIASVDLFLDYGVSGNLTSRPAPNRIERTIESDLHVSHLLIASHAPPFRRDVANEAVLREVESRQLILFASTNETCAIQTPAAKRLIPTRVRYRFAIVFADQLMRPLKRGQRLELPEQIVELIEYDGSGRFGEELAKKMVLSNTRLAMQGFSAG
jgi:hypothetical protein